MVVKSKYCAPFEACFLMFLYIKFQLRQLRLDMEQYFGIRIVHYFSVNHKNGGLVTQDYCTIFSDSAIFQEQIPMYARLTENKDGLVSTVFGMIDSNIQKVCKPSIPNATSIQAISIVMAWHSKQLLLLIGWFLIYMDQWMGNAMLLTCFINLNY